MITKEKKLMRVKISEEQIYEMAGKFDLFLNKDHTGWYSLFSECGTVYFKTRREVYAWLVGLSMGKSIRSILSDSNTFQYVKKRLYPIAKEYVEIRKSEEKKRGIFEGKTMEMERTVNLADGILHLPPLTTEKEA